MNMDLLKDVSVDYPNDNTSDIRIPANFDAMVEVARSLSKDFNHVRVDLYSIDGDKIVFGELAFSSGAGFDRISPYSFDLEMGKLFKLLGDKR